MSHSDVEKLVRERSYELSPKLPAHVDSRVPARRRLRSEVRMRLERDQERILECGLTTIFGEDPLSNVSVTSTKVQIALHHVGCRAEPPP